MVQAYVLIQTEVGKAATVAESVRLIEGVEAADDVTGPYDVIVKASASDVDQLGRLVVAKIQSIDGITRTLTCPGVNLRSDSTGVRPASSQASLDATVPALRSAVPSAPVSAKRRGGSASASTIIPARSSDRVTGGSIQR